MDHTAPPARVTSSHGDVDPNGDISGELVRRIGTAVDPGPYLERPGLDERIAGAGADVGQVRRLLRVQQ
jgi:hypothetical protein